MSSAEVVLASLLILQSICWFACGYVAAADEKDER